MSRSTAYQILCEWDPDTRWAEDLIIRHTNGLRDDDKRLTTRLVIGTLKNLRALDHVIAPRLRNGIDSVALTTLWALRLGVEQVLNTRIPSHAAVAETVDLVPHNQSGFVNAILRRILRELDAINNELDHASGDIRQSIPLKLYNRWVEKFGEDETEAICETINRPAALTFTVNTLKKESETTVRDSGIAIEEHPKAPGYFRTAGKEPIPSRWFADGAVYAQDPATALAVDLLAPKPGETVLDCCAAPGGKTFLIARALGNDGTIIATDNDEQRLERLAANCDRLGITCANVQLADWSKPENSAAVNVPTAVLIDAPCSNTGVLRRRVDARYRQAAINPKPLNRVQRKMLTNVLQRLPEGGRCVYSTCSIDDLENANCIRKVIDKLHAENPNRRYRLVSEKQSLPHRDSMDGHYAALIVVEKV